MLPYPTNTSAQKPRAGQPPELDIDEVLRMDTIKRPGQFPWLCGGFFAAFASTIHFGAGLPQEQFGSLMALSFSLGMCGGWIIRQAGESAFKTAVTKQAWTLYHRRRAREFRWG